MKFKQFRSTASNHRRYGSRHTRTASKLGVKPIDGNRLEKLLKQARPKPLGQ